MNISGLQYNLNRKTLEIYLSGCDGKCDGCHNKELWDYKLGKNYNYYLKKIAEDVNSGMIDEFWILGGDPMDQEFMELYRFVNYLNKFGRPIWLWTRHSIKSIPDDLKKLLSYIKTGEYRKLTNKEIAILYSMIK